MNTLELDYQQSAEHVYALLRVHGHRPAVSSAVLAAGLQLLHPATRGDLLREATEFFRTKAILVPSGLEELPSAWLHQLPALLWRSRKPHWNEIPYMIRELGNERCVLRVAFARATEHWRSPDQLGPAQDPTQPWGLSQPMDSAVAQFGEADLVARPDLRSELFGCLTTEEYYAQPHFPRSRTDFEAPKSLLCGCSEIAFSSGFPFRTYVSRDRLNHYTVQGIDDNEGQLFVEGPLARCWRPSVGSFPPQPLASARASRSPSNLWPSAGGRRP